MEDYDLESLVNYFQNYFRDKSKEEVVSMFWETYDCLLTGNQVYANTIVAANEMVEDFLPLVAELEILSVKSKDPTLSRLVAIFKENIKSYLEQEKLCGLSAVVLSDIDSKAADTKVPEMTLDDVFR